MPITSQLAPGSIAKPGVCTSSTRPASPYQGQMIWQTDNSQLLVYNGSAWVCLTPQSGSATNQISTTNTTPTTLTSDPSVSLVTGTKALITISARQVLGTTQGYVRSGVTVSGATSITATPAKSVENYFATAELGNDRTGAYTFLETGLTAGTNTFQLQHWCSAGNLTVTQRSITVVGIP